MSKIYVFVPVLKPLLPFLNPWAFAYNSANLIWWFRWTLFAFTPWLVTAQLSLAWSEWRTAFSHTFDYRQYAWHRADLTCHLHYMWISLSHILEKSQDVILYWCNISLELNGNHVRVSGQQATSGRTSGEALCDKVMHGQYSSSCTLYNCMWYCMGIAL